MTDTSSQHPTPAPSEAPKTLRASHPEDLLAAVPLVLGFHPQDSVVMLTFGSPGQSFHARVDLPRTTGETQEVADVLLAAARRNEVPSVGFVYYTDDAEAARGAHAVLEAEFGVEAIAVKVVMRADGRRWYSPADDLGGPGVPYDVASHPFSAQAVFEGAVTHASRTALAATLEPDPEAVESVRAVLPEVITDRVAGRVAGRQWGAEARWTHELVDRHLADGRAVAADDLPRLLLALCDDGIRDSVASTMARPSARAHELLWTDVLRRSPDDVLAAPATLLALAGWLAGDGALAWCALDRAGLADRADGLPSLIAQVLEHAVPPSAWQPVRHTASRLLG